MDITVIGLGYVGLTCSLVLASYFHNVIGFDKDKERIGLLKQGVSAIDENHIQELLDECKQNMRFTYNAKDAIRPNKIFFIAVNTVLYENDEVDLSNFYQALDDIAENAIQNSSIIICSTVPIGTSKKAKEYIKKKSKFKFDVISMPQFMVQGNTVVDFLNPTRILVGTTTNEGEKLARDLLNSIYEKKIPTMITSPENAEITKIASNTYLAMRLSFVNELAKICDKYGGDIDKVSLAMSLDPRIGFSYFKPGFGIGGISMQNDTSSFAKTLQNDEVDCEIISSIPISNQKQIDYFIDLIFKRFKSVNTLKVAVLGLAYKSNTDDVRGSLAIKIVSRLLDRNAEIYAYDELAEDNFKKVFYRHTHIHFVDYATEALNKADFAVIASDSDEFKKLTNKDFISLMRRPIVFDGRNIFKIEAMDGVEYYSVGRRQKKNSK